MSDIGHEAAIPNPKLKHLEILIGEWTTIGSHPLMPGVTLHGRVSFSWIENGAFLMMRSEVDEPRIPSGITIVGSDNDQEELTALYFDERGVSRKMEFSLHDNVWRTERMVPKFSQRFTGTITDNGNTIIGVGELNEDDVHWKPDLSMTYTRVK